MERRHNHFCLASLFPKETKLFLWKRNELYDSKQICKACMAVCNTGASTELILIRYFKIMKF